MKNNYSFPVSNSQIIISRALRCTPAAVFFPVLLLAGCGGENAYEPTPLTGVFVDSPVSNIAYRTSTLQGVTNAAGEFEYVSGERVTFSIGGLDLPSVVAADLITPQDLVGVGLDEVDNIAVINIARLLQSLDADGNPDNGIEISAAAMADDTPRVVDFTSPTFDQDVSDIVPQLISAASAAAHLRATLDLPPVMNTAPVADAGEDLATASNTMVTLDGTASTDSDGDFLTYSWELISGPQGNNAFLDNPSLAQPVFSAGDVNGDYLLSLVVSDGLAQSAADEVTVTVFTLSAGNTAPVADAGGDLRTEVGDSVEMDGSGSVDNEGGESYLWTIKQAPPGGNASISDAQLSVASFNPGNVRGVYTVKLTVDDGEASDVDQIQVAVGGCYDVTVSSTGIVDNSNGANITAGAISDNGGTGILDTATGSMNFSLTQLITLGVNGNTSGFAAGELTTTNDYDLKNIGNSKSTTDACNDTLSALVCTSFSVGSTANANVVASTYVGDEQTGDNFSASTFDSRIDAVAGQIDSTIDYNFNVGSENFTCQ